VNPKPKPELRPHATPHRSMQQFISLYLSPIRESQLNRVLLNKTDRSDQHSPLHSPIPTRVVSTLFHKPAHPRYFRHAFNPQRNPSTCCLKSGDHTASQESRRALRHARMKRAHNVNSTAAHVNSSHAVSACPKHKSDCHGPKP
jgi:hypothetical protein